MARFQLPKPTWARSLAIIGVSVLIIATSFVLWASSTNPILPDAVAALQDSPTVDVTEAAYIEFMPQGDAPTAGIVFYPGGRVQAAAYAPLARGLAEQGYYAAIVYAPLNLAFFAVNAADAVLADHPEITRWAVTGHSLGGVAASIYADSHPGKVQGLAIMASYPANSNLATRDDLSVISVYGSEDGLAKPEQILASADDLPASTQFIEIVGGNHGQFGSYGVQDGDKPATISREEQHAQIISALGELLASLSN